MIEFSSGDLVNDLTEIANDEKLLEAFRAGWQNAAPGGRVKNGILTIAKTIELRQERRAGVQ